MAFPDFLLERRGGYGNLLISVRMRAPFAPHMSCGSRANQANLKREYPVPSNDLRPLLFADDHHRCVMCVETHVIQPER